VKVGGGAALMRGATNNLSPFRRPGDPLSHGPIALRRRLTTGLPLSRMRRSLPWSFRLWKVGVTYTAKGGSPGQFVRLAFILASP